MVYDDTGIGIRHLDIAGAYDMECAIDCADYLIHLPRIRYRVTWYVIYSAHY
jgi:hypothetical protein